MKRTNSSSELFYPPVNRDAVKVLTGFIKNETTRTGIKKCIIGLSGGIDSAISAYLAVKALGKKNVIGVLLPYKLSSKESISDALLVVKALGIKSQIINITSAADEIISSNKITGKIRIGNVLARIRMICLYDLSAKYNALVLGTGNKTELLLGYSTLFGDSACAINPLGDLYKTQIWQLGELLKIPKRIIKKKPSADLWEGQTDENELGFTYKNIDRLLYYMVDLRVTDDELIEKGFDKKFIAAIKKKISRTQFKRVMPLIAKVSNRTINVDFRYNRDWMT